MVTSNDLCGAARGESSPGRDLPQAGEWTLRRWQVSFRSGKAWYGVGEFVALDAAAAIARAVEIFGPAEQCRAEEIPWDAAPLPRVRPG